MQVEEVVWRAFSAQQVPMTGPLSHTRAPCHPFNCPINV